MNANDNEILCRINDILNNQNGKTSDTIKELRKWKEELKPKPEFIEGELASFRDNITQAWQLGHFSYYNAKTKAYVSTSGAGWMYCKKLTGLPMNMIRHNGSDVYPDNADNGDSVIIAIDNHGEYIGGLAHELSWSSIRRYQILIDLNREDIK